MRCTRFVLSLVAATITTGFAHAQRSLRTPDTIWRLDELVVTGTNPSFLVRKAFILPFSVVPFENIDTFDKAGIVLINGEPIPYTTGSEFSDDTEFSIAEGSNFTPIGGDFLAAQRFDALLSDEVLRVIVTIINQRTETRFVTVSFEGDVASQSFTTVLDSAQPGATTFEDQDGWVISDESFSPGSSPAILHAFFGGLNQITEAANASISFGKFGFKTEFSVRARPNELINLVFFYEISRNPSRIDTSKYESYDTLEAAGYFSDFPAFLTEDSVKNWGPSPAPPPPCSIADLDLDDDIDVFDLITFLQNFDPQNPNCPGNTPAQRQLITDPNFDYTRNPHRPFLND